MKTRKRHYNIIIKKNYTNYFKNELEEKIKLLPSKIEFVIQKYNKDTKTTMDMSNKFLDSRIAKYLEKRKFKVEKSYKINNKIINIKLFFFKETSEIDIELILKKIHLLILLFFYKKSTNININIYFTHFKKMMPFDNDFTSYNVNSGVCSFHPHLNNITIYREEEWFKVLIHELFHALNFDNKFDNFVHPRITDKFNIKNLNLFSETYVELWATFYNVIISVFLSNKIFSKNVNNYLRKEFMHCIDQNKKILHKFNTNYQSEIEKPSFVYLEKQNILYYYLFKMILFFKLNEFFTICESDDNLLQLNKEKTTKLLDLILNTYKKPAFIRLIKHKRLRKTRNLKMTIT